MKQKGNDFMQARQQETAPAAQVVAGDPVSNTLTEDEEIQNNAKAVAAYANAYTASGNDGMF